MWLVMWDRAGVGSDDETGCARAALAEKNGNLVAVCEDWSLLGVVVRRPRGELGCYANKKNDVGLGILVFF